MKLLRPYIPLEVRCQVARRQAVYANMMQLTRIPDRPLRARLNALLQRVAVGLGCEVADLRLDHDPALENRVKIRRGGVIVGYRPAANDPDHLCYRPHGPQFDGSHAIKTNIRGDNGQLSDNGLARKNKRMEQNRGLRKRRPKARIASRKNPWPKRKFAK